MKKLYLLSAIIFFSYNTKAQVGIGTTAPRAALDITSSTNGFLAPQVALTSTTTASPVVNPQGGGTPISGTIVYNTATAGNVTPGYYYWNGTAWKRLSAGGDNWAFTGNTTTVTPTPAAFTLVTAPTPATLTGKNFIGTTDATDFVAGTNNTERLRINSNGLIGIGTSAPRALLDISNNNPSNYYGIILPKANLTSTAAQAPITNPQGGNLITGTIVYNANTNPSSFLPGSNPNPLSTDVTPGYYYWNNLTPTTGEWIRLATGDNWSKFGNKETVPGNNFIGTTDAVDFVTKTNNAERLRITKEGMLDLKNGHIKSEGTQPIVTSTNFSSALTTTNSTNTKGSITTTSTGLNSGTTITVTFATNDTPYTIAPTVILTAGNSNTATKSYYVTSTTTSFTITLTAITSSDLIFNYMVIE